MTYLGRANKCYSLLFLIADLIASRFLSQPREGWTKVLRIPRFRTIALSDTNPPFHLSSTSPNTGSEISAMQTLCVRAMQAPRYRLEGSEGVNEKEGGLMVGAFLFLW
jgi:hypothetical protein